MRFDKMLACAAVLGCTVAVNLDTTSELELADGNKVGWGLGEVALDYIENSKTGDVFRPAYDACLLYRKPKVCQTLQRDVLEH